MNIKHYNSKLNSVAYQTYILDIMYKDIVKLPWSWHDIHFQKDCSHLWGFAQMPYMQHLLDCFEIVTSLGNKPHHDIWERKETCYDPPHCMITTPKAYYYVLQGLNIFLLGGWN
jgi:hypothetical protein